MVDVQGDVLRPPHGTIPKAYLIKRQIILETQNVELVTPLKCVSDFIKVRVFQNNQSERLKD